MQVPVPLFIVTVSPLTEHTLVVAELIVGVTPEFSVVPTVKLDRYAALVGAPVNVTVGVSFAAVVRWVAVAAA